MVIKQKSFTKSKSGLKQSRTHDTGEVSTSLTDKRIEAGEKLQNTKKLREQLNFKTYLTCIDTIEDQMT